MSLGNLVKRLQDIMRNDAGVNGDAQRIEQIVWILYLKGNDYLESLEGFSNDDYEPILKGDYKWSNWAFDNKDGKALTGEELLDFVNNKLFPTLKNIEINENSSSYKKILRSVFEDTNNYMKDGTLLRQVINVIDEIDFGNYKEVHALGDIYESILRSLQSANNAGEFYTPRALTDFIISRIKPKLGETIADFACGTGGFLTSALNSLEKEVKTTEEREQYNNSVYGIEKKGLPFLLCATNMIIHKVSSPMIFHSNSLEKDVREYNESDKFEVIVMNPPYGGSEKDIIKNNFPASLRSSETADLFVSLIMYRLKSNGRAAIILPDGFLFGEDNAKVAIKSKLLSEFNLHTLVRLPNSVFAPYTSISTNILFFDNSQPCGEIWFYRVDMPFGYKNFSKTKPIKFEHFNEVIEWWENRENIIVDGFDKARVYSIDEIKRRNYNLDLCGYPHEEEDILEPNELINIYKSRREVLNSEIDSLLETITCILNN